MNCLLIFSSIKRIIHLMMKNWLKESLFACDRNVISIMLPVTEILSIFSHIITSSKILWSHCFMILRWLKNSLTGHKRQTRAISSVACLHQVSVSFLKVLLAEIIIHLNTPWILKIFKDWVLACLSCKVFLCPVIYSTVPWKMQHSLTSNPCMQQSFQPVT